MLHVGMDMHKRYSVVTVVDEDGEELVKGKRLENEEAAITDFIKGFGEEVKVVLEAGFNWYWMCDLLDGLGVENVLCHPLKTKAIASARIKTDKLDSAILSHLSRMDFVPEAYKPDIATRHLRELLRYRASLVSTRTGLKNKVHAILARLNERNSYTDLFGKAGTLYLERLELAPVYRKSLDGFLRLMREVNLEIEEADAGVRGAFAGSAEAQLLATIPGVGRLISLTILAEIVDIDRFHSAKHLASYAGLIPSTSQSGDRAKHGRITRQGSKWLRWALVEAAIHAVGKPGPLRDYYQKLKKRKGNKIARVAVARKLCTYIYHMLREGKDFDSIVAYSKSDLG